MVTILLQKILDLLKAKLGLINTMPETASGATVVFDTDKELPLDVLKATITASQESGTPTPEDPKAITGYDSVVITQKDGTDTTVNEITVALGQTIYGGVLDVKNGTATITHGVVDLGNLEWIVGSESTIHIFKAQIEGRKYGESTINQDCCEQYDFERVGTTTSLANLENNKWGYQRTNVFLWIRDDRFSTPSDFTTGVTGVKFVYELAKPITLSGLTPANITTINGTNKLSANCGDLEIGYRISDEMAAANKDISSDVTVNISDYSSVSYKVIRAGNVVMISLYSATVVNSTPAALFTGLPKPYNNVYVNLIDTVSNGIVAGSLTNNGSLGVAAAEADQRLSGLITYITKDEV